MVNHIWLWLPLQAAALLVIYILLKQSAQFKSRTIDEVIPFLRKINHEQVRELFSPAKEEELFRFIFTSYRIRRTRRARLDQARECLLLMLHNTRILQQWANPEYRCARREPHAYKRQTRQRINALCQSSMLFYHCASITVAEINFWMIVSSIPGLPLSIPGAARFRDFGQLDLLAAYEKVRDAAAEFALVFGEEYSQEIMQSM